MSVTMLVHGAGHVGDSPHEQGAQERAECHHGRVLEQVNGQGSLGGEHEGGAERHVVPYVQRSELISAHERSNDPHDETKTAKRPRPAALRLGAERPGRVEPGMEGEDEQGEVRGAEMRLPSPSWALVRLPSGRAPAREPTRR